MTKPLTLEDRLVDFKGYDAELQVSCVRAGFFEGFRTDVPSVDPSSLAAPVDAKMLAGFSQLAEEDKSLARKIALFLGQPSDIQTTLIQSGFFKDDVAKIAPLPTVAPSRSGSEREAIHCERFFVDRVGGPTRD